MERTAVGPDGMTIEFSAWELATLTDLIGQEPDLEERRTGPLDDEEHDILWRAYELFSRTLSASWKLQEALGRPFRPCELVISEPQFADQVDLGPSGTATMVRERRPDAAHDYDWCIVRRADGSEVEVPSIYLRRAASPGDPT